jgi:hypothetical protein
MGVDSRTSARIGGTATAEPCHPAKSLWPSALCRYPRHYFCHLENAVTGRKLLTDTPRSRRYLSVVVLLRLGQDSIY